MGPIVLIRGGRNNEEMDVGRHGTASRPDVPFLRNSESSDSHFPRLPSLRGRSSFWDFSLYFAFGDSITTSLFKTSMARAEKSAPSMFMITTTPALRSETIMMKALVPC